METQKPATSRPVLPQPSANSRQCTKCFGTGFYCMGILNGRPYSHTGFTCYPCNGTGWKTYATARPVNHDYPATRGPACPGSACKVNAKPTPRTYPSQAAAKREIQAAIDTNVQAFYKALLVIHSKQTEYEQQAERTEEANGVGFGAYDAEFLSSLADKLTRFGSLTEGQIAAARPKVRRYWKQLMRFSKEAAGV